MQVQMGGWWVVVVAVLLLVCRSSLAAASQLKSNIKPNVVLFFIDDMGWGDLPPYGHPTSVAPNIQRMADQGLLFTQHYTNSPVCSPSRAGVLTGRYQIRSGIYPGVFAPDDLGGLPLNETTIAEGLQDVGYATGMVGKWHLGVGENGKFLPNHHGFDYYMGIPYTHDDCPCYTCFFPDQACYAECNPQYVPCPLYECKDQYQTIIQQPADLTTLSGNLADAAVSFVKHKAYKKQPFFLYYAFQHIHGPQFAGETFRNASIRGPYGDSIREIDWAVGQIFKALKETGVHNNTFVFLTADNGPDLLRAQRGGSAGLLRCGKATTWDGGMRAPGIAWWPNRIKHGRTHQLTATLDLLPTIFSIAGAEVPNDRTMDGYDISNVLFNHGKSEREMFAFFPEFANETQGPFAIRWKQYKAHYWTQGGSIPDDYPDEICRGNTSLTHHDPPLLYNLHDDPQEITQLDPNEYASVLEKIDEVREKFLAGLEWATPQLLVGSDASIQPCAQKGCEQFPYCCRIDTLSARADTSPAWL